MLNTVSSARINPARTAARAILASLLVVSFGTLPAHADPTNDTETKCQAKVAKSAGKIWKTAAKGIAKCRDSEIAGKGALPCPDAKTQAKIDKAVAKLAATVDKSCGSVCSTSPTVTCLSDASCPPDGASFEACSGTVDIEPFDLGNLGFPGSFCASFVAGEIIDAEDLSECISGVAALNYGVFESLVYGSTDSASGLTKEASGCLKAASKSVQKVVNTIFKSVSKCRDAVNKGKLAVLPSRCKVDDAKTADSIAKALGKLGDQINAKCTDGDVALLDVCGNGAGGTLTAAAAVACLSDAADELGDSLDDASLRDHAPVSLVEAAFPPADGVCGDGVANQLPHPFLMLGEECDLVDDDACPGECLPPGDLFECTCGNIPRMLNTSVGAGSDLDIGWTGFSHSHEVMSGAAYITDLSGCDCDDMNGAECVGSTSNPVCTLSGNQLPTCSWELFGTTSCDDRGDGDDAPEDSDCFICDALSANAGTGCSDESDCQSQCYDASGSATGLCSSQSDCAAGEVCRGRCDTGQTCVQLPHGPPIPLVTGGAPSCLRSPFFGDVVGTQNIVTGEHERSQFRRTLGHTGDTLAAPCPICGGFCDDTTSALLGRPCQGTCSITPDRCRFDDDCPVSETCTTVAPECGPGTCNLDLICRGGPNGGQPCRVHGAPGEFGTTSADCPPNPGVNFSGTGTPSNFDPATSEAVALDPVALPCDASQFELYDCPCPSDGAPPGTKPNLCAFACNAGAEFGTGCTVGSSINGEPTRCVGGVNDGAACDEDTDCAPGGGTCSGNPLHCLGDVTTDLDACTTNGDCGAGTCVDACPSGRCVPLCTPQAGDPEEGECTAGPTNIHCSNEKFRTCSVAALNGTCDAVCSIAATPCTADTECPSGETCDGACLLARNCEAGTDGVLGTIDDLPGAGVCTESLRNCYNPDLAAEGGDTFNGNGDPILSRSVAAYCTEANLSPVANAAAGLGGPGRIRSESINLTNGFETLP